MTDHDVDPLPPDVLAWVQQERARPGLTPAHLERMRTRVERTVGVGGLPGQSPAKSLQHGVNPWLSHLLVAAMAGIVGAALQAAMTHAPPAQTQVVTIQSRTPAPVTTATTVTNSREVVALPDAGFPLREGAAPVVTPMSAVGAHAGRSAEDRDGHDVALAAERNLVEMARTSIDRGDTASALDALTRASRESPHGQLMEEREILWIQALVASGQYVEARTHGERFHRLYPHSPAMRAVDAALRSIP